MSRKTPFWVWKSAFVLNCIFVPIYLFKNSINCVFCDLTSGKVLGSGAFGEVYLAEAEGSIISDNISAKTSRHRLSTTRDSRRCSIISQGPIKVAVKTLKGRLKVSSMVLCKVRFPEVPETMNLHHVSRPPGSQNGDDGSVSKCENNVTWVWDLEKTLSPDRIWTLSPNRIWTHDLPKTGRTPSVSKVL